MNPLDLTQVIKVEKTLYKWDKMFYFNCLLRKINHVRTFPIFHGGRNAIYFRDKIIFLRIKLNFFKNSYIDMHTLLLVSNQKHLLIFITPLLE